MYCEWMFFYPALISTSARSKWGSRMHSMTQHATKHGSSTVNAHSQAISCLQQFPVYSPSFCCLKPIGLGLHHTHWLMPQPSCRRIQSEFRHPSVPLMKK